MVLKKYILLVSWVGLFAPWTQAAPARWIEIVDLKNLQPLNSRNIVENVEGKKEKILYFWATWCEVCKSKLTSLWKQDAPYQKYDVYLVATDFDKEKIEHFQNKYGLKAHVVIDPDKKLQQQFEISGVPTLVRLKPAEGKFAVTHVQSGGDIEKWLQ